MELLEREVDEIHKTLKLLEKVKKLELEKFELRKKISEILTEIRDETYELTRDEKSALMEYQEKHPNWISMDTNDDIFSGKLCVDCDNVNEVIIQSHEEYKKQVPAQVPITPLTELLEKSPKKE